MSEETASSQTKNKFFNSVKKLSKKINYWLFVFFLLSVLVSAGVTFMILSTWFSPFTAYDPNLTEHYEMEVGIRVQFFNGTVYWHMLDEDIDLFTVYNNPEERFIRQDYTFLTSNLNLSYTTFTKIELHISIPQNAYNKFPAVVMRWIIEDKEGTLEKSKNQFTLNNDIYQKFTGVVDITTFMFREIPPNLITAEISFFNRT